MSESIRSITSRTTRQANELDALDAQLVWGEVTFTQAKGAATYAEAVNLVRADLGQLAWDGLLVQAVNEVLAETEPTLRAEALEYAGALAIAYAKAVYDQTAEFNAEEPEVANDDEAA